MARSPRINVAVTAEQHALLLELAGLQGGSAAGYLRQQLDASTPLLRTAVPLLRKAAREVAITKAEASTLLQEPLRMLRELGMVDQLDLLDDAALGGGATHERTAASRASEAVKRRAAAGVRSSNGKPE